MRALLGSVGINQIDSDRFINYTQNGQIADINQIVRFSEMSARWIRTLCT